MEKCEVSKKYTNMVSNDVTHFHFSNEIMLLSPYKRFLTEKYPDFSYASHQLYLIFIIKNIEIPFLLVSVVGRTTDTNYDLSICITCKSFM